MRNFSQASVTTLEEFRGEYRLALKHARKKQKEVHEWEATSYTIEGENGGEAKEGEQAVVKKHVGQFGGQPPRQEIIFSEN